MTRLSKHVFSSVVLTSALVANLALATNKCYILAMSSGQEQAAYQAGVLKGLASKLTTEELSYQAVSGIAGGAVNAAILSGHSNTQINEAIDKMIKFWTDGVKAKLYQNWWGGVIAGLFTAGGIYDNSPLTQFLQTQFNDPQTFERDLSIGLVDSIEGQYKSFQNKDFTKTQDLRDILFASFASPGYFPPADVLGSKWFDGSAVYDIDIFTAVNKCFDKGFIEENIVVDLIMTSSANLKEVNATEYHTMGMLFRYLEISSFYSSMDGLLRAKFSYPKANFRYAISPSKALPSSSYPLNLDEKQMNDTIQQGIEDAIAAINQGSGQSVDHLIHYHLLKSQNDDRIDNLTYGGFMEAKANGDYDFQAFDVSSITSDPSYIKYQLNIE
ncbi:patatin-like phospholipase family protein [Stylonychia lemnae]|uniref:Patatin-like phospholipase family protein n=1 Tax=Stylonychia lemnae TaxID=5949 RepID=A0A078A7N5_STYLE|nr:patatin-like phospholipase family protein [Stylonychia lemnae]|eukprot:CDW78254.1 patatin-like phospholipase family protein [Stylonychia lemnae]